MCFLAVKAQRGDRLDGEFLYRLAVGFRRVGQLARAWGGSATPVTAWWASAEVQSQRGMIDDIMYSCRIQMPAQSCDLIPVSSLNIQAQQMDCTTSRLAFPEAKARPTLLIDSQGQFIHNIVQYILQHDDAKKISSPLIDLFCFCCFIILKCFRSLNHF